MTTPRHRNEIPTPALVLDLAALDRNIARMASFFRDGACRLRPHFKAHKTPAIAQRQLAAGACVGLTCATIDEAETVAAFCQDVLVANEVVSADKCARLAGLAHHTRVTVAVDSPEGLEAIAESARAAGVPMGLLVDLDVGQRRCGVAPGEAAVALAQRIAVTPGVTLRGVMGYEGHVQPVRDRDARRAQAVAAMQQLVTTAEAIRQVGLLCDVVSGGGSGTYDISGRVPGVTEIQAGSYVLMDTDYAEVGLPFEQAFVVLGTVVSRPAADRCVVDCGHKSQTKDHGLPGVWDLPGARVTGLNDEHATLFLPPGTEIAIGARVALVPSHTDPTVNLHDVFYVVEGDAVVACWPIAARGYAAQRR
jgi:D-serine deaminase-like pyridoxal phosphate-dependent protein